MAAQRSALDRLSPQPRGLVQRAALFERLSETPWGGVALVCAPAGSGKTVLVRSWLEAAGLDDRAARVCVERGETDGQRFWLSVIDALVGAAGPEGLVARIHPAPGFRGEAVVDRLVLDLEALDEPVVLVLDDVHELHAPEALGLLEQLVVAVPSTLGIVLATREEPRIGLHRLRVAGALTEVRAADLRFSLDETRELLESAGVALSDAGVALLHERSEGWAAGVRLAAISLAGHPEPERFVREFSGSERTVARYLLAEVLECQAPEVRDVLLRTSVLERVSGPLADALTGGSGSERILQELEDANAFVTALDVGRSWFRYHHLFADLLRLELRRASPLLIPALHRAAAEWLERHGHVVEAIRHAQAAPDWPRAARLLADNYVGLVLDGRKDTLRTLLAAFPADEADPELALAFATGRLYDGLLAESSAHIAAAEELAATVPAERRRLFDRRLTSARLWLACQRGDLDAARQAMRSLEGQSADTSPRSSDHRASGLMNLGMAELWSLHLDDASRHLEEALTLARRIGRPFLEIGCLAHLALAAVLDGAIPAGLRLAQEAVEIAEAHGWGTQRIVAPAVAAGAAALAWLGRVDEAEQWLERVESAGARQEEFDAEPVLHHAHGFVRLGKRRYEQALAEFRAAARAHPWLIRQHVLAADIQGWRVQAQVLTGDTAGARAALAALDARERAGTGMRLAEAALALAAGGPERAIALLAPVIASAPPAGDSPQVLQPRWATMHALLLDAVARDHLGDPGAAEASLERALGLAEQEGVILPFLVVEIGELLERHRSHRTAHGALLAEILDVRAGSWSVADAPALLEPLSDAELRVLRYLPSNLRAPEIAAELLVSCNTVRTHLRHIYAKLDAHSRNEAVTRARRLGLLAPASRLR